MFGMHRITVGLPTSLSTVSSTSTAKATTALGPRTIFAIPFGLTVAEETVWLSGHGTDAPLNNVRGSGIWAINFNSQSGLRWIRKYPTQYFSSGSILRENAGLSLICSGEFMGPASQAEEIAIDSRTGAETRRNIHLANSDLFDLRYPFYSNKDGLAIFARRGSYAAPDHLFTLDNSWLERWKLEAVALPPGFPPNTRFVNANLASTPKSHPSGLILAFNIQVAIPGNRLPHSIVALMMVSHSYQTVWMRLIADAEVSCSVGGCDSDLANNIFIAVNCYSQFSRGDAPKIFKYDQYGDEQLVGWPQILNNQNPIGVSEVSVSGRMVYVCGQVLKTSKINDYEPFVASFKFDGTSSSLFGMNFRFRQEEWRRVYIAAKGSEFFLGGYCIDSSDPQNLAHCLHVAKYDQYGLLL